MKYITEMACFNLIENSIRCAVERDERFPERVFCRKYGWFLFIAFDMMFTKEFFNRAKRLLADSGERGLLLSTLDPDPVEYFFKNFGAFGAIKYSVDDSDADYLRGLNEDPGGSPADALMHNCNLLAIVPSGEAWVIVGDRDADLGICGFLSASDRDAFLSIYGTMLLHDAAAAADYSNYMSSEKNFPEFMRNFQE